MGKWKGIKRNLFKTNSKLELYDLDMDEKELNDVANLNPKVVDQMEAKLKEAHSTPCTFERDL